MQKGDFTTDLRLLPLVGMAVPLGVISAFCALFLLKLIAFFTWLFLGHVHGPAIILVPALGGLIVGLMARYGSERIRGHGIPEALEAILMHGSRVDPKVAILKPLSSAIAIGSGGPFGAEGPIIMTGGAVGSVLSRFFSLSANERKTMLVAGAAGGMSATFAAPVSSCLLAVELLLFEYKPRSFIPVAFSAVTAAVMRRYLLGVGPLFPTPVHPTHLEPAGILCVAVCGLLAGAFSATLTLSLYRCEGQFMKLPIHWMWWPALGGLAVGLGGFIFPQALGVGYDVIGALLQGSYGPGLLAGVLLVKSTIWLLALSSGTSGGVLAPLLMMGGALGGLEAYAFPHEGAGFWPLISMAAILAGTMRSPLTGVVFALELTHDGNSLLPLLLAAVTAHGFTVLTMKRSILTEKLARRGHHLTREYGIDPLEILMVRDVMRREWWSLPPERTVETVESRPSRLLCLQDADGHLVGVVTARSLQDASPKARLSELANASPQVAYPHETVRSLVDRMAGGGATRLPVVDSGGLVVGYVALADVLKAHQRNLSEDRDRVR